MKVTVMFELEHQLSRHTMGYDTLSVTYSVIIPSSSLSQVKVRWVALVKCLSHPDIFNFPQAQDFKKMVSFITVLVCAFRTAPEP